MIQKCVEELDIAKAHGIQRFFWTSHQQPEGVYRKRIDIDSEIRNEIDRVKEL